MSLQSNCGGFAGEVSLVFEPVLSKSVVIFHSGEAAGMHGFILLVRILTVSYLPSSLEDHLTVTVKTRGCKCSCVELGLGNVRLQR